MSAVPDGFWDGLNETDKQTAEIERLRDREAELLARLDEMTADRDWWQNSALELIGAIAKAAQR